MRVRTLSDHPHTIERMFDSEFRHLADAEVVAAIEKWSVAESAAAAHRLAAVAEIADRRSREDEENGSRWVCDSWDSGAAEVAAALGIGHSWASSQMHLGMALRVRLPRVAALFWAGRVPMRVVEAIVWRTGLVAEPEAMAVIDAAIAELAASWQGLSRYKLEAAIDTIVDRHDPAAVRRSRASARSRDVSIGAQNHETGTASLWGRLFASDAALLERRLDQMARGVCVEDPRTLSQRRADALGALAAGSHTLACQCSDPDCPAGGPDARATSVVIHVLADSDALTAEPDPHMSGEGPTSDDEADAGPNQAKSPVPTACTRPTPGTGDTACTRVQPPWPGTAVIVGGGMLPTPLLAALVRSGASVRELRSPSVEPEPRYRPGVALSEFVRMRDLTCRFPGCDKPADFCDLDHRVPWPYGATHPSTLRTLCRLHHLLRTFWTDWTDIQHPDGTIEWTTPSGRTYTTRPGSQLLFPAWNTNTGSVTTTTPPNPSPSRGLMMPTRSRTRAAERTHRINRERALNEAHLADRNHPPPF